MSWYYFFSAFLLLLVCFISCASADDANSLRTDSPAEKHAEILKAGCVIKPGSNGGADSSPDATIERVDNVFFITTSEMLVAVAEAKFKKQGDEGDDKYDFVAAYVETKNNWDEKIFTKPSGNNCGEWKTQLATKKSEKSFFTAKNVVYNAEKKTIYLLAVNKASADNQLEYNIVIGNVSEDGTGTSIAWSEPQKKNLDFSTIGKLESTNKLIESSSTDGGSFVTKDGKVVFMLRATGEIKKYAIVFLKLKEDNDQELDVLHVEETAENCYPYLFSWSEKIIMITTNCTDKANQNVKESSTDITQLKESPGLFYYSSDFLKDKTSFTTAYINSKTVLLFAQKKEQCSTTEEQGQKKCFTFWFSDGNRTYNIGETVLETKNEVVSSSIIFANEKLFFLVHQKSEDKKFILTRLDKQLKNITETLNTWKSADGAVLNLCKSETSDAEVSCSALLLTEGLVGFLSNRNDDPKEWKDEYLYKNATITGEAQFKNGLKCNKAGQGAKWHVDKGDENQPYKFTTSGFTLLATLRIDGNIKNDDNSLLGLVLNDDSTRIGLWCTTKDKWAVSIGKDGKKNVLSPEVSCKPNKIYFVAFILNKQILSIYVDGQQLTGLDSGEINIASSKNTEHFYFGSDNNAQTAVTITSVLLYNRPLEEIIKQLKPKENKVNTQTNPAGESNKSPDSERSPTQTKTGTSPPNTSATKDKTEETQPTSPPPTTEDGAVRVGVVGVLCFMLCGVFTLLGRYVY